MKCQRGAALILALWASALLSLTMGSLVATARLENRQTAYQLDRSKALIAAEAGLALSVQSLLAPETGAIHADNQATTVDLADIRLTIAIDSERGKVDINFAGLNTISRLLNYLSADARQTQQISTGLAALRKNGQILQLLEQVRNVPGMTPVLYDRLEPCITLWTGLSYPDAQFANPQVRQALGLTNLNTADSPGSIVTVRTTATLTDGFKVELQATVLLQPGENGQLYRVLRWKE